MEIVGAEASGEEVARAFRMLLTGLEMVLNISIMDLSGLNKHFVIVPVLLLDMTYKLFHYIL
jgi:hypothetical protein